MSGKPGGDPRQRCGPVTQPNHSDGGSLSPLPPPPSHTVHIRSLQYIHLLITLPVFAHPRVHTCTPLPVCTHSPACTHSPILTSSLRTLIEYIRCSGWSLACCCACCPSHSLMLPTPATSSPTHSFAWPICSSFISIIGLVYTVCPSRTK